MWEYADKLKRHFRFSKGEVQFLLIGSIVIGFIFALRKWQNATIGDFILGVIIVLVSLTVHLSGQKMLGIKLGLGVEYKMWWNGLAIGLIASIISRGRIWWLILPGGIIFSLMARERLGRFRYGLNYWPLGWIGFMGPIFSIILGTIFKNIEIYLSSTPVPLFQSIFVFNLALAVCTMLPIPPLDGHYMFYGSRSWFVILFGTVFAYALLVALDFYSWIFAIIAGLIIWLVYYFKFEKEAWGGG